MIRKIVKAGNSSHTISLPKSWVEKHNLEKGNHVIIQESEGSLVVAPYEKKAVAEKEFLVDASLPIADVRRLVTGAYMRSFSRIIIHGVIKEEHKKVFSNFPAVEIVEESDKRIVARDILDPDSVDVKATLKRMDMMVRTMFESVRLRDMKKIDEQDFELNKLYFLLNKVLRRIVAGAISSPLKAEEVFATWSVIQGLEGVADGLKSKPADIDSLESLYRDAVTAYHTSNVELANKVIEKAKSEGIKGQDRFIQESITSIARTVLNEVVYGQ